MFRKTDRQTPLFEAPMHLAPQARAQLERGWVGQFRKKVLPVLYRCEERFRVLYPSDVGRPNWSVARRLGLMVLQEMSDLPDQAVLEAMLFDARFQYALSLSPDEAYLSRRSLVDFRSRLVAQDPEMRLLREVFDALGEAAIGDLSLSLRHARLDSTQITSNIRHRGRVDLFGETLRVFLRDLAARRPRAVRELYRPLQRWWAKASEPGWFGQKDNHKGLTELARWVVEVVQRFTDDAEVSSWESWQLVRRLFDEHITVEDVKDDDDGSDGEEGSDGQAPDGPRVRVRKKPTRGGRSLQSPHDPDAGRGRKGVGYHVQVVETCGNKAVDAELPELITDFEVVDASTPDWGQTAPTIERLKAHDRLPEVLLADAGYPSGATLLHADAHGVDLISPVSLHGLPKDVVGRHEFKLDQEGRAIACPQGHAPVKHLRMKGGNYDTPSLFAYFDPEKCETCPLAKRCVVRPVKGGRRRLELRPELVRRDRELARQRTPAWKATYRPRSGIEATCSELKRKHGLGRLRVRREPRVRMAVTTKVTACNVKRWLNFSARRLRAS